MRGNVSSARPPGNARGGAERVVHDAVAELEPGTQLPPVKTWATELRTTRATLGCLLKKLEAEGLVVVRHGWEPSLQREAPGLALWSSSVSLIN